MTNILVTGGSGMVGKNLQDYIFEINDTNNFIFLSSKDCNLTNQQDVNNLFEKIKPNYVIHLAANVGGLYKNMREKTAMFKDNVRINENILEACNNYNVQKGIFCLSSCIYPHSPSKYPMDETMIHESEPHPSNEGYGYSKRMMEMQCRNYNKQFGRQYICLTPVNIYGYYDNFNLNDSHVIAGLIHRFYLAKNNNTNFLMYGTGTPLRQFIFAYDFAKIIYTLLFNYDGNIGNIICSDNEISIRDLTYKIADLLKYNTDKITNDLTKSDGCLKKTVKSIYFDNIFTDYKYTTLDDGLKKTIEWFINNYDTCKK
jgi:GDP-L-fucose synthase